MHGEGRESFPIAFWAVATGGRDAGKPVIPAMATTRTFAIP